MTTKAAPTVLLIDALNLVRRIHAAVPDCSALLERCGAAASKLLNIHQPTHGFLVWDGGHEKCWRRALYPDYKSHRKPMPTDLAAHLSQVKATIESKGIKSVLVADIEADDIIATLATKLSATNISSIVVSTDFGFGQLHRANISQWNHFEQQWLDETHFLNKFGVHSNQLTDFLALVGDKSNGIPGVPGIGKKGAVELISQHQTIERMLEKANQDEVLSKKIKQHQAIARLSYQLATLKSDINLNLNLNQFRIEANTQ